MIETATNVRPVFPLPAPSYSCSARLPVPVLEDDFRWNVYYPPPPSAPPSDCSSQRSAPGGEMQYTCRLRQALDKSRLQKSRSRDNIDDVDVLRHGDHLGSLWGEFGAPRCEYPPQRQPPLYQRPQYVHSLSANTWTPLSSCGGGWAGVRTGRDVSGDATMTTSGCRGGGREEEEEEEANFVSPPKIMPFSGRIVTANDHSILKPVPFKPVSVPASVPVPCSSSTSSSFENSNFRKAFSHNSSLDRVAMATASPHHVTVAPDDGYASREWQNLSCASTVSQEASRGEWPPSFVPPSSHRRRGISFTQTPSPSDSGVGEVEAMLREREMELQTLRERMERNETAMLEVFEERRRRWERETGDVIRQWQVKVQGQEQRSFRAEQGLLLQIFKLQQENRKLREENNNKIVEKNQKEEEEGEVGGGGGGGLAKEPETAEMEEEEDEEECVLEKDRLKAETEVLRSQLRDAVEEAARKTADLISAQLVLKDNEIEQDSKNSEIRNLLADVDRLKRDLLEKSQSQSNPESSPLSASSSSTSSSSSSLGLAEFLEAARREVEKLETTLELERRQWSDEKTKVINYQKHLQLNYVQMAHQNKLLQVEVQRLMTMTSELDGRRHGNECRRVVKEESLC